MIDKLAQFVSEFATLKPVSSKALSAIRNDYFFIPDDYMQFLAKYGVGATAVTEWYFYEPIPAREIFGHQSALIYNSEAAKAIFFRVMNQTC